jgi:hypothetical protein
MEKVCRVNREIYDTEKVIPLEGFCNIFHDVI